MCFELSNQSIYPRGPDQCLVPLTVSLPNKMSTYGMTFIKGSLKNWLMKGAERFMQKTLLLSEACLATLRIDSGDTVRKKPWKQHNYIHSHHVFSFLIAPTWKKKKKKIAHTAALHRQHHLWSNSRTWAQMDWTTGSLGLKDFKLLICGFWILTRQF